jgi:hypothetical protein
LVTVLVTVANIPPSPLIAQLNGLIPSIHQGSVAVCHSWSLSVSAVLGRSSKLRVAGSIPAGRTIADVLLPNGTNVNYQLVKDGWCWWYKRYAPGDAELERLETEA